MIELLKDWNWFQWWLLGTTLYLAALWLHFKRRKKCHSNPS